MNKSAPHWPELCLSKEHDLTAATDVIRNLAQVAVKNRSMIKNLNGVDSKVMKNTANNEPITNARNTKKSRTSANLYLSKHPELGFTLRSSPRQVPICTLSSKIVTPSDNIQVGHTTRLSPRQASPALAPRCPGPRNEADNRLVPVSVSVSSVLEEKEKA